MFRFSDLKRVKHHIKDEERREASFNHDEGTGIISVIFPTSESKPFDVLICWNNYEGKLLHALPETEQDVVTLIRCIEDNRAIPNRIPSRSW